MKAMSLKQRKNIAGSINPAAIKGSTGRNALIRKELADHLTSKRFLILLILIGGDELCKPVWRDLRAFRCDLTGQQFHLPEAVYVEWKLDPVVHVLHRPSRANRRAGTRV